MMFLLMEKITTGVLVNRKNNDEKMMLISIIFLIFKDNKDKVKGIRI